MAPGQGFGEATQAIVEPEDSDCGSTEDSGFTSVRAGLARQSTSNSLQIPGDAGLKASAELEVAPFYPAHPPPPTASQDSETQSEVETLPNYDSSDGEIIVSRSLSRNHSLTSSGGGEARPGSLTMLQVSHPTEPA